MDLSVERLLRISCPFKTTRSAGGGAALPSHAAEGGLRGASEARKTENVPRRGPRVRAFLSGFEQTVKLFFS